MIDFLRYSVAAVVLSLAILVAGFATYLMRGELNYDIDFTGGFEYQISAENPLSAADLRAALSKNEWKGAVIQSIGSSGKQFLVRLNKGAESRDDEFLKIVKKEIPDNKITIDHSSWIGAEVGADIKWNALISILLSLISILGYIALLRSHYRFAVGAVVALAHDLLVVIAVFVILNEQISSNFLAALLTTLGYSINDTIIIYSRLQENLVKMRGVDEISVINLSLNQTLRRTILTSMTTFLALASIYALGGEALRGFSLAMMVGVIAGTYSSIYIASPIALAMGPRGSLRSTVA